MEYYKIATGKFIEYDVDTERAIIFLRSDTNAEIIEINKEIASLSKAKTNAELLQWARENYPYVKESERLATINVRLNFLQARIDAINLL